MKRERMGVLIASGRPQVRDFLGKMVEKEGAMVIGQATDVTGALALTRHLRPDAIVIDFYLPHVFDSITLSPTGGLDAARMISDEIPDTKAILVNNLDDGIVAQSCTDKMAHCFFARDSIGGKAPPSSLQELCQDMRGSSGLIFANVEIKIAGVEPEVVSEKLTFAEKTILTGICCIFGGFFLTATGAGAPVGIPLGVAGAITVLSGKAFGRLASRW